MARTTADEMSAEERRIRLLNSCKAGGDDEVFCIFSQVAHALDMDTADKLRESPLTETQEVYTPAGSSVQKVKRDGVCQFNRPALIAALEAKIESEKKKPAMAKPPV